MTCDDFEVFSLDRQREHTVLSDADAAQRTAAVEHIHHCPRCAALQQAWRAARVELQALRAATQAAETPSRVEIRLGHEFRTKHRTLKMRKAAVVGAWALAAVAVLAALVSWPAWRIPTHQRLPPIATDALKNNHSANASAESSTPSTSAVGTPPAKQDALLAGPDGEDFTWLPGSGPQDADDAAIVRVGLQRGTLIAWGFPVSEDHAGDWIQIDLLVGEDGQPQGMRLAR
jgi:anti-sigma factor RsiW